MTTDDDWVEAAFVDDTLVAELLSWLKESSWDTCSYAPPSPSAKPILLPPLVWGHRQPRSRITAAASVASKKESEPTTTATRCSPTTPLSWSGGSSAGASHSDGNEDTSRHSDRSSSGGGSKYILANESAAASTSKKSRKKKTFPELKEEEDLLLKEQLHLKRELDSMHVILKEQRAESENFKRIKLDLNLQSKLLMGGTSDGPRGVIFDRCMQMEATRTDHVPSILPRHDIQKDLALPDNCRLENNVDKKVKGFIVPDLNMTPTEEDLGIETLYGVS